MLNQPLSNTKTIPKSQNVVNLTIYVKKTKSFSFFRFPLSFNSLTYVLSYSFDLQDCCSIFLRTTSFWSFSDLKIFKSKKPKYYMTWKFILINKMILSFTVFFFETFKQTNAKRKNKGEQIEGILLSKKYTRFFLDFRAKKKNRNKT